MFLFYFFSILLIYFSFKSLRSGINYLNFFRRELAKNEIDFAPFVSIIAPCRGLDADLEENLRALFRQNFPKYEIVFAVDDERDEAVFVIKKLIAENPQVSAKLIVAPKTKESSQKVENLREAVLKVSDESEIFVFVDSDARPVENWLKNLIAPLKDEKIGAATGYRWFISKKRNLASELRVVWNASIASALGENVKSNFCWGGSMAMRREVFEKLEMREKWRGTVSDDFAVTRAMKEAKLPIFFVPQALTASVEDCSFSELFEFTTRQMKITRVYAQNLWIASFIGSGLFNLVWIWGIFNLIFLDKSSFSFWFTVLTLLIVSIFSIGKSWLRLNAVKLVLEKYKYQLNKQFTTQNTLWIFTPAIFFYNAFCALISRKIVWRGITYELESSRETIVIKDNTTNEEVSTSEPIS
ncbi:MAG TPA: glycosyltransferase [Pyrinomonadaceae bacterium]|nr:glycosyltransferase [Pyrinomonadaceae bacterium]